MNDKVLLLLILQVVGLIWGICIFNHFGNKMDVVQKVKVTILSIFPTLIGISLKLSGEM